MNNTQSMDLIVTTNLGEVVYGITDLRDAMLNLPDGKTITKIKNAIVKLSNVDYSFIDKMQKLADLKINVDLQAFNDFAKSINVIKKALSSNDIDFSKFTDAFIGMVERLNNIELSVNFVNFSKTISETTTIINQFDKLSNEAKTTGDSFDNLKNKSQHTFGTVGALFSNIFQDFKNLKNESKNTDGAGSNSFLGKFQGIISIIGQSFGILSKNLKTAKSNFNGLGATTKNVNNSLKETKSLAGILAKQFLDLGKNIARSIRNFIGQKLSFQNISEYASSLVEVQNVIDKTFGESAAVIENFTKTSSDLFGINTLQTKQYAGRFQAMGVAIGLAKDQMAGISETMTKLSADYASFYNTTFESAAKDMMAIFDGQSRKMKKYGIDITDIALQEYALANGITKSTKVMTQREKAQLRFNLIMERSKDIMGDFNLTHTSWANQIKLINNNMQELGGYLGTMLTQTLRPILIVVNQIISRVNALLSRLVSFLALKFNWQLDFKGGLIEEEADSAEDLADNLDEAGKAAKNASTGIDELNILTQPSNEVEPIDAGGLMDGWDTDYAKVENVLSDLEKRVNILFDKIIEKLEPLKKVLSDCYNNFVKPLATMSFSNLKEVFNSVIKPISSLVINDALPTILNFFSDLGKKINWDKLTLSINKLIKAIGRFATGIGKGFINFFKDITPYVSNALAFIVNSIGIAFNFLANVLNAIPVGVLESLGRTLAGFLTFNAVIGFIQNIALKITNLASAFGALAKTFMAFIATPLGVATAIAAVGVALWQTAEACKKSEINNQLEKFGTSLEQIDEAIKKVEELKVVRDNYISGTDSFGAEAESIRILADKYFELADMKSRTAEQDYLLKYYAGELIKVCPELEGSIDKVTGAYKGTREEIEKVIEKTIELARTRALESYLNKAAEDVIALELEYSKAEKALKDFQEQRKNCTYEHGLIYEWNNAKENKMKKKLEELEKSLDESKELQTYFASQIVGVVDDSTKQIEENTEKTNASMIENTDKAINVSKENIGKAIDSTTEKTNDYIKNVNDNVSKVDEGVNKVKESVDGLEVVPEKIGDAITKLDELSDKSKESGFNVVEGFNEGIQERYETTSSTMDELGQYVINSFDDKLGIHSPSTVFNDIAGFVIDGYVNGIKEYQNKALDTMKYLADNIQKIFKGDETFGVNYYVWSEYAHQINLGFADGINTWGDIAIEAVRSWAEEIMSAFEEEMDINSPSKVFKAYGGYIVKGLSNGIDENINDSVDSIKNLGEELQKEFEKFSNFNVVLSAQVDNLKGFELQEKVNVSYDMTDFYKQIEEAQKLSINAGLENYNRSQAHIEVNIPKISVEVDSREIARANYKGQKQLGYQIKR